MLFISEAKKVWWRNAFYGHQKSVHYKMWSDTITEEKGILWYWFWHIRTWRRVKFFISVYTIASKVKMCVAGKNLKWNQREIQSTTRILLFSRHFSTRPPFSPRDPNKAKRCDVVIRSIWYRRYTLSLIMYRNKLAKARKTSKSSGTLGLKNLDQVCRLWVKKVWAPIIFHWFFRGIG